MINFLTPQTFMDSIDSNKSKNVDSEQADKRADEKQTHEHNRQMKNARKIMKKYNSALHDLAKL